MADLPNYKKPEDLTPTEQFILTYGTPEQKKGLGFQLEPPVTPYDPKIDAFGKPIPPPLPGAPTVTGQVIGQPLPEPSLYDRAKEGIGKGVAGAIGDAAAMTTAGPAVALVGKGASLYNRLTESPPTLRDPKSFENTTPKPIMPQPGQPWTAETPASPPGTPVSSLPDARSPGGGGPARPNNGLGSDKALQGAQQDQISGSQALVDKKMDEAAAHLEYRKQEADAEQRAAFLRGLFATAQKQADDEVSREQEDFDKKRQEAADKAAKMGVDPGRLFRGRETQAAFALAIGGALSGVYGALTNSQENGFVNTVRQLVQQDIDVQNREIDQAWKKVSGMETTYQNLVKRGVDKRAAQATYYGQILDANLQQLKSQLTAAKIPEEKANLEGAIQSLQNERTALDIHMQEYWKSVYEKRSAAAAAQAAQAAERLFRQRLELAKLGIEQQNADTQRLEATGKLAAASGQSQKDLNASFASTSLETLPDGTHVQKGIVAADPQAAKELRDAARNHEATLKAIAEIRRLRGSGPSTEGQNKPAGGMLGRANSATTPVKAGWERGVDSESSALKASLNKGAGLGAYDNGTAELLNKRVGELRSVGRAGDQLLDQLETQANREYDAYLNANGGRPAARVYNPDTKTWQVHELSSSGSDLRAPTGGGVKSVPGAREIR